MTTTASTRKNCLSVRVTNSPNRNQVMPNLYHRIAQRAEAIAKYKASTPTAKSHI